MDFVKAIEKNACDTCCGEEANINLAPRHPADTLETWSNTEKLQALGYSPKMDIQEGVDNFYKWYVEYHDGR
jgi:UDP-glucuronate 4-epimerase